MPSTYSNLKIQLMATGENNTTWGDVTNLNLGTALEEAIVGSADVAFSGADVTLTLTDTNASQTARNMRLNLTGTATAGYNLIVPSIEKPYIVNNGTDGTITVKNATGTGIAIPAGKTMWVYNTGTNVVDAVTHLSSLTLTTDLAVPDGGTGASTFTSNGVLVGNGTSALQATAAGTTGQVLTGNTGGAPSWSALSSIAVTSFSGSTTGLTPATSTTGAITLGGTLVVGNGGTGSNTAAGARTNLGVPANDGTGATGTWGINVTGNAGTVTNGVYTTGNQTIGGLKTFSSTIYLADGGFVFNSDGAKDTGMSWASDGVMNVVCNGVTVGQFNSTGFTGNAANVTGTVAVANGGTGATSLTSGYLLKGNGTSAVSSSVVYDTGTNVGIGTSSPTQKLTVSGGSVNADNFYIQTQGASQAGTVGFANADGPGIQFWGSSTGNAGSLTFNTTNTERMRITSAGNVGIGTSSPGTDTRLNVAGRGLFTGGAVDPTDGTASGVGISYDTTNNIGNIASVQTGVTERQLNISANPITFRSAGSERMRISSAGRVGIGTTNPQATLHVRPTTDVNLWTTNDSTTLRTIAINDGVSAYINWRRDANQHTFETNGSERVRFSQTGNVGIGTTSPAQRIHAATTAAPTGTTQSFLRLTGDSTFGADFGGGLIQGTGPIATISTVNAGTATERMRIDGSGNVGIGSTGGDYGLTWRLIVKNDQDATTLFGVTNNSTGPNASTQISKISGGSNNYVSWRLSGAAGSQYDAFEYGTGVTSVRWNLGGSERMRIDSSGNVGIGTSAPNYLLHLNQNGNTQAWISATNAGSNSAGIGLENQGQRNWQIWADRTNDALQFGNNNRAATNMAIKPAGQVRFIPLASAPSGAEAGDVYYDSGTNKLRCYNGTTWNDLF